MTEIFDSVCDELDRRLWRYLKFGDISDKEIEYLTNLKNILSEIKTKNDALLNLKHDNNVVVIHCKEILKL